MYQIWRITRAIIIVEKGDKLISRLLKYKKGVKVMEYQDEYYVYYTGSSATDGVNTSDFSLIKVGNHGCFYDFYAFDAQNDCFSADFYDENFSLFADDWLNKSEQVRAISYYEMVELRNKIRQKNNPNYAKQLEELEDYLSYETDRIDLFKSMTYAYASLTHLWGEVFDEKEYITNALTDKLAPKNTNKIGNGLYFLPPSPVKLDDETVDKFAVLPFLCSYDTDYDKKFVWTDGGIFYNGEMINLGNGHNIVLKVTKFQVRLDGYDKKLRAYPIKTVGYWSLIYN